MKIRKTPNIKYNFIFNILRIITNILFPIITFPYVSRILNPDGIGKVTFTNSISAYFLMFASLGIPLYGIREIAMVRDNSKKLEKVTSEIFLLNFITTIVISILYFIFLYLGYLGKERTLLEIMSLNIFLTFIGIEWFYQGMEEYRYITIRSIIFRAMSLILIFSLVKTKEDYIIYGAIMVFSSVGSNIFNFFKLKTFIKLSFKNLEMKRHIKPIITIFSMNIAISIYTNLDNVMLGYKSTDISIGLYSSGIKMVKLVLGIVTSLGAVMLPRISNYIHNEMEVELKSLLDKSFKFITLLSLPCCLGLYLTSKEIILIFSGEGFIDAVNTMKYLTPIIIFIALSNFIGIQILYPRGEEKKVLISVIIGAIINFSLNWILIPKYAQDGAAISTTVAEGLVLLVQILLGYKYLRFIKYDFEFFKTIIATIFMGIIIIIFDKYYVDNIYLSLLFKILIGSSSYLIVLIILKDKFIYEIFNKILKRG
ncbi:polysaccharide biosynthesis protein [Cetobacterium somerae ATCC BAA-474]|uniref:Polysaccharide biosynthesis protein n=1 Tax=Cetobacterium somerae ATCC BAA-474 TaxID=1319815 RepID=U7V8I3_9FUSO|nr:flippase [Cetobacterium somerae]ERT67845.1 polysaccharide biosynthesis protein [Cetobacterium somerae ATCC BAA-474]